MFMVWTAYPSLASAVALGPREALVRERAAGPAQPPRLLDEVSHAIRIRTMLYGSGLRLLEGLRLRIKDVDFGRGGITVRGGKGGRDRRTVLPGRLSDSLVGHLEFVRRQHGEDVARGASWRRPGGRG